MQIIMDTRRIFSIGRTSSGFSSFILSFSLPPFALFHTIVAAEREEYDERRDAVERRGLTTPVSPTRNTS